MKKDIKLLLGGEIRRLRVGAGMTIEDLAFRAGVHYNYLGDVERGRRNPSLANLEKIARGLKVRVSQLFPESGGLFQPRMQDIYDSVQPLIKLLKDSPPEDRSYILEAARSFAKRLKHRRK